MTEAQAVRILKGFGNDLVSDHYADEGTQVAEALHTLIPKFEYPDWDCVACQDVPECID